MSFIGCAKFNLLSSLPRKLDIFKQDISISKRACMSAQISGLTAISMKCSHFRVYCSYTVGQIKLVLFSETEVGYFCAKADN